ncbi:MAG: efflux RND transporter periplasmic adaptor subunit [Lentisphaeraceae bacterium]|nr:efflux RND transporter periplasmic adaptor subunit [Lentisphaeraceae bacterium]
MKQLLVLLLFNFCLVNFAQRGPTPVFTKKARTAEILNRQLVTGSLRSPKITEVAGIEAGRVNEVHFKIGDTVKEGDVLVVLDNRRIKHDIEITSAQFNEIEAGLKTLKSELNLQKEELDSLQSANKKFKGSVSAKDVRATRLIIATTEGRISELEAQKPTITAQLAKLKTALEDTTIKAPFDGSILERYIQKGAWLETGGKIAKLQSFSLKVALEIPEKIKPELLTEDSVVAYADSGKNKLKLSGFRILRVVDKESRNYLLLASIEKNNNLLPGMSVTAEIPQEIKQKHLLIPTDAIQRNGAGYFVFKVLAGEKGASAMPVNVQILFRHGEETAVSSPMITDGDAIVVEGNERLFPMMPVKAVEK